MHDRQTLLQKMSRNLKKHLVEVKIHTVNEAMMTLDI